MFQAMAKSKRPIIRIIPPNSEGPPALSNTDTILLRNNGSSLAVDATKERLEASKRLPTLSAKDTIIELHRVQGRLRMELDVFHKLSDNGKDLQDQVAYAVEILQVAILKFKQRQKEIESEFGTIETS
jgi:hypothetical protein